MSLSIRKKVIPKIVFENHDRGIMDFQVKKKFFYLNFIKNTQNNSALCLSRVSKHLVGYPLRGAKVYVCVVAIRVDSGHFSSYHSLSLALAQKTMCR